MNNFEHATEATATGLDSAGSAAEENAKWMQSLEAQVQELRKAFQDFATNVIDSDLVKTFLNLGEAIIETLDTPIGRAITTMTLFGGVIVGGGSIIADYVKKIQPLTQKLSGLGQKFVDAAANVLGFNTAAKAEEEATNKNTTAKEKNTVATEKNTANKGENTAAQGTNTAAFKTNTVAIEANTRAYDLNTAAAQRNSGAKKANVATDVIPDLDNYNDALNVNNTKLLEGSTATKTAQQATSSFSQTAKSATTNVSTFSKVLSGVGKVASTLGAVIGAIGLGITVGNFIANLFEDARTEATATTQEIASTAESAADAVTDITSLYSAYKNAAEGSREQKEAMAALAEAYGIEYTNAADLKQQIEELTAARLKDAAAVAEQARESANRNLEKYADTSNFVLYGREKDSEVGQMVQNYMKGFLEQSGDGDMVISFAGKTAGQIKAGYEQMLLLRDALKEFLGESAEANPIYQDLEKSIANLKPEIDAAKASQDAYNASVAAQMVQEWSAGTEVDESSFQEYIESVQNSTEYTDDLKLAILSAAQDAFPELANIVDEVKLEIEELPPTITEVMDALDKLSGSFDTITDALEDFQDDGEVTFSTLSNLLDTFSDVEGIEDFISQLAEGGMSAEEFKTALDNLTYAKIQNAIETQGLENADANLIAKMLEEAGVANADEVALAALTNAKINATLQTDGLTNAVYNEIMELVNEQGQTEATRQAIAAYWFEKALANANTIKTAADIENLISLANAAGQTSVVIDQLRLAIDYFNKAASEPNPTISAWHSKTAMNYLNRAKQLSAVSRGSGGNVSAGPAISYVPSGGGSSSSGGGGGSSGGGTSTTVEDTSDPELERHQAIVEALKTELDIMQAKNEPYDAQIRKMQEIQNALHEQAEYMRSIGATEQEINELSLEWWNIQNDINDLLEEALDTYKEYLEEQAEGIESALDYAISQAEKEIESIEDWYDQLIAEEEARQEALEQTNEELENQIALEEKLDAIARARSKKLLVYKDGRFQYVQDVDEVSAAQSDYQQYLYEQQQKEQEQAAQDEIDRLEAEREEAISIWEQYIKDWESVVDSYEDAQDRLLAEQILGIDFEQKNWAERLGNAEEFAKKYAEIMDEIASINEMQDLGELVDMNVDYSALMLQAPNEQIFNALAALRDWKAHILGITDYTEAGFRTNEELRQEMGFAKGTLSAPGGLSLVGENGPELRVLNQGDGIIPANLTKNLMDLALNPAETGDTNINIENVNLPNVQNGQDFVDYLRSNIWRKTIQYKTSKR